MIATVSVLFFNRAEMSKRFLQNLEVNQPKGGKGIQYLFTDNGSMEDIQGLVFQSSLKNKMFIQYGHNLGFPEGHNRALQFASAPYFICLNNDLVFQDTQWLYKLILPMEENPDIALVGLEGTPCTLRPDGCGFAGREPEYVEASCLAGRTDMFKQFGLFSPAFKMFCYEDSDMSLRYRQMGYKIGHVPIQHTHVRSQTLNIIDPDYKHRVFVRNKDIFMRKWSGYLAKRSFNNNILVRILSHGGGDVICATPVLESLRREHPTADIQVETNWPDVFENNPYISSVHSPRKTYQKSFDRIVSLDLNYASYKLIYDSCEEIACTSNPSKTPQIFLNGFELDKGKQIVDQLRESEDDIVIGIATQMARVNWHGRNWRSDYTTKLIRMLREYGVKIIELGKGITSTGEADLDLVDKTSLREAFAVVANLDILICVDSLLLHVAQAFAVPTYVLFGATEPISRVVDFSTTCVIRNDSLPCLGCYQRKGKSDYNQCLLRTEDCMNGITPETVFDYIVGNINGVISNSHYLQEFNRNKINGVI